MNLQVWNQQLSSLAEFVKAGPQQYSEASISKRKVLESVRHHGRALIGAVMIDTGLAHSTVQRLLTDLRDERLISRCDSRPYVWSAIND